MDQDREPTLDGPSQPDRTGDDPWAKAARDMVRAARMLHGLGLAPGTGGNLSLRLEGALLTTPSGSHKGLLTEADLIRCTLKGEPLGPGRPTSEISMHLAAYHARPDVRAVIHAHPPLTTALTVAGLRPDPAVLPEALACLGPLPLADYARPGSPQGARAVEPYLAGHNVIVIDRHGCLVLGPDLFTALARVEELEHLARVTATAQGLGRVKRLSPDQQKELVELGRSLGFIL